MNWMRRNVQPMDREMALASIVLPTPGTSSMRMWPSHRSATIASRTSACLPTITRSTFATMRSAGSWTFFTMQVPYVVLGRGGVVAPLVPDNTPPGYEPVHLEPGPARD